MPRNDNVIVGLDIGTTKVCAVVGGITAKGLDIVALSSEILLVASCRVRIDGNNRPVSLPSEVIQRQRHSLPA